jgi:ATP-dependent DNA ligase
MVEIQMPVLYPPHPSSKIPPHRLPFYESSGGWIAQRKFNGTRVLVHVSPSGEVGILNRHGTSPKMFALTGEHAAQILSLNLESGKEYWLDGELLDHKTSSVEYKGKIVLFDVLQAGDYLLRSPDQAGRLALLSSICRNPTSLEAKRGIALEVSRDVWMAESWSAGFAERFQDFLDMDEIEGLVLRKESSFLANFGLKKYEVSWILRCRKPNVSGSYVF